MRRVCRPGDRNSHAYLELQPDNFRAETEDDVSDSHWRAQPDCNRYAGAITIQPVEAEIQRSGKIRAVRQTVRDQKPAASQACCWLLALAGRRAGPSALLSEEDLRLPIELHADSTEYDGKSSMLLFRNMRLLQGAIDVQADEGRDEQMNFEDSVWRFNGNVTIDTENGTHRVRYVADLTFIDTQLQNATITGAPATFELKREDSG